MPEITFKVEWPILAYNSESPLKNEIYVVNLTQNIS